MVVIDIFDVTYLVMLSIVCSCLPLPLNSTCKVSLFQGNCFYITACNYITFSTNDKMVPLNSKITVIAICGYNRGNCLSHYFYKKISFKRKRHTNNLNKLCPYKHGEIFLENKES